MEPETPIRKRSKRTTILVGAVFFLSFALLGLTVFFATSGGHAERMRYGRADTAMSVLQIALQIYHLKNKELPTTSQGLLALVRPQESASVGEPFLKLESIIDPWGHPFQYRSPALEAGRPFDLWSVGPDGSDGTDDDVSIQKQEAR